MLRSVKRSTLEPHVEAHRAALTTLGRKLHPFCAAHPLRDVVIRVDEIDTESACILQILLLPKQILTPRMDVGVVEEDCHVVATGVHLLNHRTAARRAA